MTTTRLPRTRCRLFLARRRFARSAFRQDIEAASRAACHAACLVAALGTFWLLAALPALFRH